jgi:ABC-type multidrug transport system fused ATPase/permease subunit
MSGNPDILVEEELAQRAMSLALFRRLLDLTRPYRLLLGLNLVGTALAVASQLLGPKLIQVGIDRYLSHGVATSAADRGIVIVSALYLGNLLLGWG